MLKSPRLRNASFILWLVCIVYFLGGCSTTRLPAWVSTPPHSKDYINGVGSGQSPDLEMAISMARSTARARLAEAISVQTGVIMRNFGEQVAINSNGSIDTDLTQFFQSFNRDIAVEMLNGVQQKDQVIQSNERNGYRVYTWLQLPIGELAKESLARIRENKIAEARLRGTSALKDLEMQVKEYDAQRSRANQSDQ